MNETERRRLHGRVSALKHYEDALRAALGGQVQPDLMRAFAEYASALYDTHHVATHGVTRGGEVIDAGAFESTAPKHDPRASALYKREKRWAAEMATVLGNRGRDIRNMLDEIVGESAV